MDPGSRAPDLGSRVQQALPFLEAICFLAFGGQAVFKLTAELPGGLNIGDGYDYSWKAAENMMKNASYSEGCRMQAVLHI